MRRSWSKPIASTALEFKSSKSVATFLTESTISFCSFIGGSPNEKLATTSAGTLFNPPAPLIAEIPDAINPSSCNR